MMHRVFTLTTDYDDAVVLHWTNTLRDMYDYLSKITILEEYIVEEELNGEHINTMYAGDIMRSKRYDLPESTRDIYYPSEEEEI